jgi:hypothetical protein
MSHYDSKFPPGLQEPHNLPQDASASIEAEHDLAARLHELALTSLWDDAAEAICGELAQMVPKPRRPARAVDKRGRETKAHADWRFAARTELRNRAYRRGDDLVWWDAAEGLS